MAKPPASRRSAHRPVDAQEPTDQQKELVELMVTEGGPVSQNAPKAGYKDTPGGVRAARRALKLPWVQDYMLNRIREELISDASAARLELAQLVKGARSEYVRLQAIQQVLDRVGVVAPVEETAERTKPLNINIGLTPSAPQQVKVIEGEFTPAEPESPDTASSRTPS